MMTTVDDDQNRDDETNQRIMLGWRVVDGELYISYTTGLIECRKGKVLEGLPEGTCVVCKTYFRDFQPPSGLITLPSLVVNMCHVSLTLL